MTGTKPSTGTTYEQRDDRGTKMKELIIFITILLSGCLTLNEQCARLNGNAMYWSVSLVEGTEITPKQVKNYTAAIRRCLDKNPTGQELAKEIAEQHILLPCPDWTRIEWVLLEQIPGHYSYSDCYYPFKLQDEPRRVIIGLLDAIDFAMDHLKLTPAK